ncbi:MAG: ferrous iron transport protein A, partial [Aristaeellaceae bacterium]
MMPLGMANVGDVNVIEKITGRDEVRAHLAELGFVVGAQVKVVSE